MGWLGIWGIFSHLLGVKKIEVIFHRMVGNIGDIPSIMRGKKVKAISHGIGGCMGYPLNYKR